MFRKRIFVFFILGGIVIFSFCFYFWISFFKKSHFPLKRIEVASCCRNASFLIYLAKEEGFFEKNNLAVEIKEFDTGRSALINLDKQQIPIAIVQDSIFVERSFSQRDLRILAVVSEIRAEFLKEPKDIYFFLVAKQSWINQHPDLVPKLVRSLVEAEKITIEADEFLIDLLSQRLNYSRSEVETFLKRYRYYVYLPQFILLTLEKKAIDNLRQVWPRQKRMPNYLDFIYHYALEEIDSARVSLIR